MIYQFIMIDFLNVSPLRGEKRWENRFYLNKYKLIRIKTDYYWGLDNFDGYFSYDSIDQFDHDIKTNNIKYITKEYPGAANWGDQLPRIPFNIKDLETSIIEA